MTLLANHRPDVTEPPVPRDAGAGPPTRPLLPRLVAGTCLLLLMTVVTVQAGHPLRNADTWFHLRIGHELWDSWSLRHPGALSSFATADWVPTQWSTEMLAAKMDDWFGLPGVAWIFGLLFLGYVVTVYLSCRTQGAPVPATVTTALVVIAAAPSMSARPQVVSLIMLALVVSAWLRAATTLQPPWFLVPLTWVWATAHGLWTAGIVVGVVCCVGIFLDSRPDLRSASRLLAVPVLSGVAACLTPVGPALVTSQLAVGARTSLIAEWGPTSFRAAPALVVAAMAGLVVLRWARSGRVAWLPVLLLVLAVGWTALVVRMVSVGAVLVAPLFAGVLQQLTGSRTSYARPGRGELTFVAAAAVALLTFLGLTAPTTAARPADVPAGFTSRLAALPAGTPVAVEGGVGAWLEYRYPRLDPVIDGMFDAYPVPWVRDYTRFRAVEPWWAGFLRDTGARVAITERGTPLTAAMQAQLGWRVVDRDGEYVYLVAPGS